MRLSLSLTCDEARVRPDGKIDIHGVFNELQAPGFPAAQERMTVIFVIEWEPSEQGRMQLRADLVDDDDQKVLSIQGHTEVRPATPGRAPAQTRMIEPLEKVPFPHPGRYRFRLRAGSTTVDACSIHVYERPED